jgi:hypothetical protein
VPDDWRSPMVYDPELAPPPDPRGDRRIMWILGVLTVALLAGLGLAEYLRSHSSPQQKNAAKAYLTDLQKHDFTAAYGRLCPAAQAKTPAAAFATKLQNAAARGRGVSSFDVVSGNSSQHVTGGSADVAQADVRLANGQKAVATLLLITSGGRLCVLDPGTELF